MRVLISAGLALAMFMLMFLFVIGGGLDKFRDPINIVLPAGHTGTFCIEAVETNYLDAEKNNLADARGFLIMETNLLRSHRRKLLFRQPPISGELEPIDPAEWGPVRTEHEPKSNRHFTVYWIGTEKAWLEELKISPLMQFCIGR